MATISVKLDTTKLNSLRRQLIPRAEQILDVAAFDIEVGWKGYIVAKHVIDTGMYRDSIGVVAEHPPLTRIISDGVEYGIYQELGTTRFPARPCATPAVEDERSRLTKAWEQLLT